MPQSAPTIYNLCRFRVATEEAITNSLVKGVEYQYREDLI